MKGCGGEERAGKGRKGRGKNEGSMNILRAAYTVFKLHTPCSNSV